MIKLPNNSLALLALPLAFLSPLNAATTTDPVGVVKHTLKAGMNNLLGLTLHNPISVVSKFSAVSGTTLTDSAIDFTSSLTSGKTYILEITSGTLEGTIQEITSWTTNTITTNADLETDGLAVDDTYQLRQAATLQQIFGENNEAGLQEGFSGTADLIWVPDGASSFVKYYYHPGASLPVPESEGWKVIGGGDAPEVSIVYSDSIIIESRSPTDLEITLSGSVITNSIALSILGRYTFVSSVFPVGSTLSNSGLADSMLHGFTGTADLLWMPKDDATGYDIYYYHPGASLPVPETEGWKLIGGGSSDQANTPLKSGLIIERRAAAAYNVKITPPASYSN